MAFRFFGKCVYPWFIASYLLTLRYLFAVLQFAAAQWLVCISMGGSILLISNRGQWLQNSVPYIDISRRSCVCFKLWRSELLFQNMSEVPMIRERDGFRNGRSCVHFVFMTSLTAQIVYCANIAEKLSTGLREIYLIVFVRDLHGTR